MAASGQIGQCVGAGLGLHPNQGGREGEGLGVRLKLRTCRGDRLAGERSLRVTGRSLLRMPIGQSVVRRRMKAAACQEASVMVPLSSGTS
jgi:hypothetical protein